MFSFANVLAKPNGAVCLRAKKAWQDQTARAGRNDGPRLAVQGQADATKTVLVLKNVSQH